MRHLNAGRKFGRNTSHRRAMFRNLAANLIAHERIETTDAKAKELRRVAERLLTKAIRLGDVAYTKNEDLKPADQAKRLHAQRLVGAFIPRFGTRIEKGGDQEGRPRREGVRRSREALPGAPRRLHAHHQARPAPRRQRADVAHRVRAGRGLQPGAEGVERKSNEEEQRKKATGKRRPPRHGARGRRRKAGLTFSFPRRTDREAWRVKTCFAAGGLTTNGSYFRHVKAGRAVGQALIASSRSTAWIFLKTVPRNQWEGGQGSGSLAGAAPGWRSR